MPVLDDPISPNKVHEEIKRLKPGKASGPDGIGPGVLRYLPEVWVTLITILFNIVFDGV